MNTRLGICFAMNTLSQFLIDPRHVHLIAAKHILRYLRGTIDYGIKYEVSQKINLGGYVDSYWEGSAIDRKSTLGCCFSMESGVISWFSRKQSFVALSTPEAEYVAAYLASYEAIWLRKLLSDVLISSWMLLVYIVTTRVVRICWRTRCSVTSRSISRSSITISGIWCRGEQ